MPVAMQLGGGTAGLFCPRSADPMSVSLTWLCGPEISETPEVEAFLPLEKSPHSPPSIHRCSATLLGELCLLFLPAAEEPGLIHPLPNNPWKNYNGKAHLRLLFSDGFAERGPLRNTPFSSCKSALAPCPFHTVFSQVTAVLNLKPRLIIWNPECFFPLDIV